MSMNMFMYKEGVANVIAKLSYDGVYGNLPELVNKLWKTRKEHTDTWTFWWENYLLDAGLPEKQVVKYSKEMAIYSAAQCGIILYYIDAKKEKEVYDVHSWQAELFRSSEFEVAAEALARLYNYCEEHGLIDNEAVDAEGHAYRSVSLELHQFRRETTQRTAVEIILRDEASGYRAEQVTL